MRKKELLTTLAISFILSFQPVHAQFMPYIPAATLQAAKEAGLEQTGPRSQVVRVGIGTSNFGTYQYSDITIYGTGDTQIYDNKMLISNVAANSPVRIKLVNGIFNIYTPNNPNPEQVNGPVEITSNYGLLGVKGLNRAGKPALYHGAFELVKSNAKTFNLVNMIEVEDYLKGVVPNEMPVSFGLEALKAQSVAARNYVLSPRTKSSPNYDVVDSVASQVYFGANTEKPLSNQAVSETEGVVAIYNWDLILAQYSSTAGGYTESYSHAFSDPLTKEFPSKEKPYLKAKPDIITQTPLNTEETASAYYKSRPDAYDIRSPYFRWTKEWNSKELHDILQNTLAVQSSTGFVKPAFKKGDKLDELTEIRVKKRGDSGKIVEMEIVTKTQCYKVFKELVVRRLLTKDGKALPSANVVFENNLDEYGNLVSVKAYGGGFGHGVGMSQYGAGFMGSELHRPYEKILQHYYSGITLSTKPVIISDNSNQRTITQNFYTKNKYAHVIVDNKFQASKIIININGKENCYELPTNMLGSRIADIDISKHIKQGRNTITFIYPPDEDSNKAVRLYVELVKKDDSNFVW